MKVLIACEESQTVCKAFRALGHEAYSNDLIECSGGRPEWHLQMDAFNAIDLMQWDLIIMHPPCTALAVSGNETYAAGKIKHNERIDAVIWTMDLFSKAVHKCKRVAMENPVGCLTSHLTIKPQYIQPWMFGHGETKKTGLWLYGLPKLKPTNIVEGREGKVWKMPPSPDRAKLRSKTYEGIAKAMAEQWGRYTMTPSDLINWSELSRLLCGNRSSLTPKRISKKHREKVAALIQTVENWKRVYLDR